MQVSFCWNMAKILATSQMAVLSRKALCALELLAQERQQQRQHHRQHQNPPGLIARIPANTMMIMSAMTGEMEERNIVLWELIVMIADADRAMSSAKTHASMHLMGVVMMEELAPLTHYVPMEAIAMIADPGNQKVLAMILAGIPMMENAMSLSIAR
mmetsp:Transcript_94758/g.173685  ORF Transcript_94758/g.173685 Transcript_94758/m.173685 type:complete len:157 (-) Transcript_94758:353-823(-)